MKHLERDGREGANLESLLRGNLMRSMKREVTFCFVYFSANFKIIYLFVLFLCLFIDRKMIRSYLKRVQLALQKC